MILNEEAHRSFFALTLRYIDADTSIPYFCFNPLFHQLPPINYRPFFTYLLQRFEQLTSSSVRICEAPPPTSPFDYNDFIIMHEPHWEFEIRQSTHIYWTTLFIIFTVMFKQSIYAHSSLHTPADAVY